MIRVAIVEDEPAEAERLQSLLARYSREKGVQFEVQTYTSALTFLAEYNRTVDIVFMDIELPDVNGMEISRRLRKQDAAVMIVFVTNMAQFAEQGRVEELTYETKAYATDGRTVTKRALVYLPYGYSEEEQYDILYLLHGTGDDEEYWLRTNPYNKVMLDNLIYYGAIEPLIVVTPTFYVEDDCLGGLDPLTYSFKEELRRDLMPAAESAYLTYAESCDAEGFAASRSHRAFAGLSRGAVTTLHSVLNGCLDWFSRFGTFSGSRTPVSYFMENIGSDVQKELSIDYWYVASGTFDFALPGQIQDYKDVLAAEPRLRPGENTSFDVFPMRSHTMGNWHLALYNFLLAAF